VADLRVLVVGLGLVGRQRADALRALSERLPVVLAGTVDPGADPLDGIKHHSDLSDVSPGDYDAAVVAVPHDLAADIAGRVLAAGRPVLVEKPPGVDAEQARALAAAADGLERPSFVGYNYRFLPAVGELFAAVSTGRLGRLRSLDLLIGHGGHPDSAEGWKLRPERAGGGVLLDPGVHLLDLLLTLAPDARCTHVDATTGFWGTGVEEDLVATFAADAMLATVRVSHVRWVNTFRLEVIGEDGYAIVEGRGGTYGPQTVRLGARWAWRDGRPQRETEEARDFGLENRSLADELEAVVGRWLGEPESPVEPCPATLAEGVRIAELCDELYARLRG
jgi:predicted dehydrogenase